MNRLPRKERINHNNRFFIDPRPREREREKPGFHQFCQDLYQPSNRKIGRGCGSRFQKTKKEPRDNPVEWKHPRWLSDPANTPVYKYSQWPIWPSLFHPLTLHPSSRPTEDSSFCFFSSFRSIFVHRGKEVGRLFSRWISSANTDSRFQGGATRSRWRWLHRSDSRDICIRGQARLTLSLDPFLYFSCYFWQGVGKTLTRLFRF